MNIKEKAEKLLKTCPLLDNGHRYVTEATFIDFIEQLKAEHTSNQWVSVEDDLPVKYEKVFIYPRPEYQDVCYTGHTDGSSWFVDEYDSQYSDTHKVNVTHWMPVPPNPKGDE